AHRFNLQPPVLNAYRVVTVDGTFELEREDQIQISAGAAHKGAATLGRGHLKARVELGHVVLAQKAVGRLQAADPAQSQLLRQASLPSSEVTFRTAARLRRVSRNHLHSQLPQRSTHLRQAVGIDLASSFRGVPEMATAIAIQRAEHPLALD